MQKMLKYFWILGLWFLPLLAFAAQVDIQGIHFSNQQVAFELSDTVHYRVFTLNNPSRLVVDFTNTRLQQAINPPTGNHPLFVNIRSAARNTNDFRVVIELNADVDAKSNVVKKADGAKLQLDLTVKEKPQSKPLAAAVPASPPTPKIASPVLAALESKPERMAKVKAKGRDIVVAIDAGHGGKDVGAQGGNGTQEKDVVFAIAKRLEGLVNNQPGMRAVMIRKGDYFVKLKERVRIASAAKADLFVSIHADAFNDPNTHGASVYTLSNKGASSDAARYLADSENASDLVGGAGFDDRDDTLASVLLDLSQSAAREASQNVGSKVLGHVKSVGHLHRSAVQKAGFVVLKSPDIPSILVETAFISNPEEERRLNSSAYQSKMASAVFGGILAHFRQYAPANTLMAQLSKSGKVQRLAERDADTGSASREAPVLARNDQNSRPVANKSQHVINRGESLSSIAQLYGVSMRALRTANDMADGNVRIGQVLRIPSSI